MAAIRVLISGSGRMGGEMLAGLAALADILPVGVLEGQAPPGEARLPDGTSVPRGNDPAALAALTRPAVVVDFTHRDWSLLALPVLIEAGVAPVIGTSGLSEGEVTALERRCAERGVGGVWAANFAVGAVLMMHFARLAAPHYAAAEVIELHHDGKVDAPSGTALATARAIAAARGGALDRRDPTTVTVPGTRGGAVEGVGLHSIRLPGLVAHQEVIFGGAGETLTIRHDSLQRSSFLPGVALAVRAAASGAEFIRGLEPLLGLTEAPARQTTDR